MTRSAGIIPFCIAVACGSNNVVMEPGDDASIASCGGEECLSGSWTVVNGGCSAFCSLSPKPAECSDPDCAAVGFYQLDVPSYGYTTYMATLSRSARSFTAFTRSLGDWRVPTECHLTLNAATDPTGALFACSSMVLDLPARDWERSSPELAAALPAPEQSLPVHRTY